MPERPTTTPKIRPHLGLWALLAFLLPANPARPQDQPETRSVEARLEQLETMNQAILEQNRQLLAREAASRTESDRRYRELEQRYEELRRQVESPPPELDPPPSTDPEPDDSGWFLPAGNDPAPPRQAIHQILQGRLGDGFELHTFDDEYSLRFRVLDQTDFKVFSPGDQKPARSGLYIPRVRVYLEGNLTRLFEYEVSLQRSVEGTWDLLDGNLRANLDRRLQLVFGRTLVPYSYDWYDHLEQYFITPERALFPLNFGLSREAGLMARGLLFDDRLQYAIGGFDGHLYGLADDNNTRDVVAYFNARPFRKSPDFPLLSNLNLGVSGFLGRQVAPQEPLPIRTSLQSSENDEAASQASSLILNYRDDVFALGERYGGAIHVAWYGRGFSFESEYNRGNFGFGRDHPATHALVPTSGFHTTLSYFLTGEEVEGRGTVQPLRPLHLHPGAGLAGIGAIELFGRYSRLQLGPEVFEYDFANPDKWTRAAGMTDIGWNWYLNRYVKLYFDWQHVMYDSPVLLNPQKDLRSLTNDLFWIRCQVFF